MQRSFAVIIFSLVFCVSASPQDRTGELTQQKRADIKELMVTTGATSIANQFAEAILQNLMKTMKAARPDIPDRVFTVMKNELIALFQEKMDAPGGLIEQVVPIYDKYFTYSEIKELLAFYQTDLGRKVIEVLPKATSESMIAGQAWGQSLTPEIIQRIQTTLKKEGIEMPNK